jgi:hypothetical protein
MEIEHSHSEQNINFSTEEISNLHTEIDASQKHIIDDSETEKASSALLAFDKKISVITQQYFPDFMQIDKKISELIHNNNVGRGMSIQ